MRTLSRSGGDVPPFQVLNLTCTECGKPCRTQTEQDLHTKRTGHTNFVDKVCCRILAAFHRGRKAYEPQFCLTPQLL